MEFRYGLLLIFAFLSKLSATEHLRIVKESMVKSLDIEGSSKETIATIINSSFNLRAYQENYFLPASYRYGMVVIFLNLKAMKPKILKQSFKSVSDMILHPIYWD